MVKRSETPALSSAARQHALYSLLAGEDAVALRRSLRVQMLAR